MGTGRARLAYFQEVAMLSSKHLTGVLVVALSALAAVPDAAAQRVRHVLGSGAYFPLRPGSSWSYQRKGIGQPSTWQVTLTERVLVGRDARYYLLDGYFRGSARMVRTDHFGVVTERDPEGGRDSVWYMLGASVGSSWELQLQPDAAEGAKSDCVNHSRIKVAARDEVVRVPAGEFRNVVRLDLQPPCVDAGIVAEWFAPGVGLIRREETSIAGPVVSELVYAELGDSLFPDAPYTVSLTLDAPLYVNNLMPPIEPDKLPTVRGVFTMRNHTELPIELLFSGCKSVSIELLDKSGATVLRGRGDDGGCCACDSVLRIRLVEDAIILPFSFKLQDDKGQPLADGRYTVRATLDLAPSSAVSRPTAVLPVEIQSVH
jgi:hypothetical protein